MTIEEIRAARVEAQDEVRKVLVNLANRTGLSVVGLQLDVMEYRNSGDGSGGMSSQTFASTWSAHDRLLPHRPCRLR